MKNDNSITVKTKDSQIDGDVIIGGHNSKIIKQTVIQDNSVKYETDKEENFLLTKIAPFLFERIGKIKILGIGVSGIIAGFLSIFVSFTNLKFLFWPGIVLLMIGILFVAVIQYHSQTQCKKCNKEFAYEEIGTPQVKEVTTGDGYIKKTTTRKYKCRFCGHLDIRKKNETIDPKADSN